MPEQPPGALTMPGLHVHVRQSSQPPGEVIVPILQGRKLELQGEEVTRPQSCALWRQIRDSNRPCNLVSFSFSFRPPFFFPLSSLLSTPPCYPRPTSLLLLPTALFTLSTEPPRENVFPKKTNVEEPEVGVGESLSPVRKTELPTAAEDSEMQAR